MINKAGIAQICDVATEELKNVFKIKQNDFFFTEKEIHSYFYYLCTRTGQFEYHDYNLIHTEYPTPFKCETLKVEPYIRKADDKSKNQRAHIDLVLINPNFIDWVIKNDKNRRLISGIGGKLFDEYISEFMRDYNRFCDETSESVLLYAIEFKYLRHSYSGEKYPIQNILQDINKLKILQEIKLGTKNTSFCENVKSMVFVGERNKRIAPKLKILIMGYNGLCEIIDKWTTMYY